MKANTKDFIMAAALIVATFLLFSIIPVSIWVLKSSIEAKSYNRIKNSDVTTWEAMWVELRVQ